MNLSTVFDQVRRVQGQRHQDEQTRYRKLVADLSSGADIDAGVIHGVLDAAGKSVEDLENDVQRIQDRRSLASQLAAAEKAAKATTKLQQRLETLRQERATMLAEIDRRILVADQELREIQRLAAGVEQLRYRLVETAADPELQRREDEVIERRKQLVPQLRKADEDAAYYQGRLRSLESELATNESRWTRLFLASDAGQEGSLLNQKRASLDRCRQELKSAIAARDGLQKEFARLGDEIDSIQAAKLQP